MSSDGSETDTDTVPTVADDDELAILDVEAYDPEDGQSEMAALAERVLEDYATLLDPAMLDLGWHLAGAKTAAYGKVEQPMLNHIRNGVSALVRLAEIAEELDGVYPPTETELRRAIACLVVHDYHKFTDVSWDDAESEFNITTDEIADLVEALPLDEFLEADATDADLLTVEDYRAAAVDHHRTDDAMPEVTTPRYNDIYPLVRVGDGIASKPSPDEAVGGGIEADLAQAFPTANSPPTLHYHRLDDVKGVVTNLLNGVIAEALQEAWDAHVWTIYQDGVLFIRDRGGSTADIDSLPDEVLPGALYERLSEIIPESHSRFGQPADLANDLQFRNAKALYAASGEDYLYNGAETVVRAVVHKGLSGAPIDEKPTATQVENLELFDAAETFPRSFDIAERTYGLLKIANTLRKEVLSVIHDEFDSASETDLVCRLFGLDDTELPGRLRGLTANDDVLADSAWADANDIDTEAYDLTGGGKWDYGYPIAQAYLDANPELKDPQRPGIEVVQQVADDLVNRLDEMAPDWRDTVANAAAGDTETALRAYIADITVVDGYSVAATSAGEEATDELNDPYDQVTGYYRRKLCSFCTRPVVSTSFDDLKTSGDVTTFSSGYTRYRAVGSKLESRGRPVCNICQIEFNLRETAADNRGETTDDRLFVHLVPDYFYTPFSWAAGQRALNGLGDDAYTRLRGLGEAVFEATIDTDVSTTNDIDGYSDAVSGIESNLTVDPSANIGGRSIVESLDSGYDPTIQFGTRAISYHKPNNNDTEFQFFGLFAALGVIAYTGTRAVVSDNPIPTVTGRDFDAMVRIGTGASKVSSLYGDEITLADLPVRLQTTAALVVLGYALQDYDETIDQVDDAHFAAYIRHVHEKIFPGSYLLKRTAQGAAANDEAPPARHVAKELLPYATALDQLRYSDATPRAAATETASSETRYRHEGVDFGDPRSPPNPVELTHDSERVPVPSSDGKPAAVVPPTPDLQALLPAAPTPPVPMAPDDPPTPPVQVVDGEVADPTAPADDGQAGTAEQPRSSATTGRLNSDQTQHTTTTDSTMSDDSHEDTTPSTTDQSTESDENEDPGPRPDGGQSLDDQTGGSDDIEPTDLSDVSIPAGDGATNDHQDTDQGTPQDIIGRLAATAFEVIRPTDDAPHNVERMFRESVEAITGVHGLTRDDMIYEVAGRLQKFAERIDSESDVRRVGHEESDLEGSLTERIVVYATVFVDDLVYGVYDGEVSLVTKNENELADGFYGATMQCRLANFAGDSDSDDDGGVEPGADDHAETDDESTSTGDTDDGSGVGQTTLSSGREAREDIDHNSGPDGNQDPK